MNKESNPHFFVGIGPPAKFSVSINEKLQLICGDIGKLKIRASCKVISLDLRLKCYFSAFNGEFRGFEYVCKSLDDFPGQTVTMPFAPDGFIKLCGHTEKSPIISYAMIKEAPCVYDKENKILLIGEANDNLSVYRVCENVYVGVNEVNAIGCFYVKI